MSDDVLKKFGRYFLLDRIAQGGMAEIFRARLASAEGAGRILVIKRIQSGFNSDDQFLQMFKSEIKVTMGFNHPNIVQLYDFGDEDNMPFIAMEFVDGKNARQFASRFEKMNQKLPIEVAVYIIEQAAAGLFYAHSYKDKITGESLNIVHRDISPQNILVSFDGNVKVIDFGIAKATTNMETTKAGVIKGKPSYLAPEQIVGEELDGRSDIFALGICLWELLVGRKLFQAPGENEYAVLKLIENCQSFVKAPSSFNPEIPKELDYICLQALARQRDNRYANAEEFQRALRKFLNSQYPEFSPSDVSYWSKTLFKDEIVEDRKKLQNLNTKAEQLLVMNEKSSLPLSTPDSDKVTLPSGPPRQDNRETTFDLADVSKTELVATQAPSKPAHTPGVPPPNPWDNKTSTTLVRPVPSNQNTYNQGRAFGTQTTLSSASHSSSEKKGSKFVPIAATLGLLGLGLYFTDIGKNLLGVNHSNREVASKQNKALHSTHSQPSLQSNGKKMVKLKLNGFPTLQGATILLNDQKVNSDSPYIDVPLDSPLEVSIEKTGFRPLRRDFVVQSAQVGELKEWAIDLNLEPLVFGYLTLRSTPSSDAIVFPIDASNRSVASDQKPWTVLKTPFEEQKFPVGYYQVRFENKVLGMKKVVNIEVYEDRVTTVDEKLDLASP